MVERIDLAREREQLGETLGLEQLPIRQRMKPLERELGAWPWSIGVVIVDDHRALRGDLADELVQLHLDQACLRAELDAVALDLRRHARRHLGPLQDHEHIVQHNGVLELERGQPREHLLEPLPVVSSVASAWFVFASTSVTGSS